MDWLGPIPALCDERHFDGRNVRCFVGRPRTLSAMLDEAVARNPQGEALVCGDHRLTYREMHDHVVRFANCCTARGIQRGDRVGVLLPNSISFVLSVFALSRIGAILVLLNTREEKPGLGFMLGQCGAKALIFADDLAHKIPEASDIPGVRDLIRVPLDRGPDHDDAGSGDLAEVAAMDEEDIVAILYTSGTTGHPKGAMLTHLGIVHAAMIYESCMGLGSGDRSIAAVPLCHVTGLTAAIAAMVRAAGTLIILPAFKAATFIAVADRERMTHTVMVPAMYNLCLMTPEFQHADLSHWRIGGYGGAPMPDITIERLAVALPRLKLMNAYGSTETTGPAVLMPPAFGVERRAAVGRAVPVCDIRIVDDANQDVPAGEIGEVWLKSPSVAAGYWDNAKASDETFVAGYWRSGDLGFVDADGFLTLRDRKKDMINRGGLKIYSVEVENVLAAHLAVVEAAVVARPCPVLGERVHAFVVTSSPLAASALIESCAGKLATYKIPESCTFLTTPLPRNANGKVLKRELKLWLATELPD